MVAEAYLEFCEGLWTDWLHGRLDLPENLSGRFQTDHAPEPYLRFGDGTRPLFVLFTNPGKGIDELQHRSCVRSSMSYHDASLVFAGWYRTNPQKISQAAHTRNEALTRLKELLGADCIVQFESIPFHSASLPDKRGIPALVQSTRLLSAYASHLADALKSTSALALSAVGSSKSIDSSSVVANSWLAWQAKSLLGIDPSGLTLTTLAEKGTKITCGFLYQQIGGHKRGIVLTMGGNTFPNKKGLEALAQAIST